MISRLEQLQKWWERIVYFTPPWAWRQDPYLEGIDERTYLWLRGLDAPPSGAQK